MASALIGKMKSAAVSGADATSRAAKTAKYNGDIELLSMKMKSVKQNFGIAVYQAMTESNQAQVQELFADTQRVVHEIEATVAEKRRKISELKSSSGSGPQTTPHAIPQGIPQAANVPQAAPVPQAVPIGHPAPPPPGPPPVAQAMPLLPPGWKQTISPEGREYFYNESTGQTSWLHPEAPAAM